MKLSVLNVNYNDIRSEIDSFYLNVIAFLVISCVVLFSVPFSYFMYCLRWLRDRYETGNGIKAEETGTLKKATSPDSNDAVIAQGLCSFFHF